MTQHTPYRMISSQSHMAQAPATFLPGNNLRTDSSLLGLRPRSLAKCMASTLNISLLAASGLLLYGGESRRRFKPKASRRCIRPFKWLLHVKNQDDMDLERMDMWVKEAKKQLSSDLQEQNGVWYRGFGSVTLELNMNFFVPVVSNTSKNEFGPGIYVTPSLSNAKDIAGRTGAIMVFKDINERDLDIWELSEEEWKNLVVHFLTLSRRNISIPVRYKEADVICGPVSQQSWSVSAGELTQRAFVSYRSCERPAAALRAIIFVENE